MNPVSPVATQALQKVIGRALEARQAADGRPFLLGHLITNRCPCSCASCLWKDNDCQDVPYEEICSFYRQAAAEGFVGAAISGGEPFLRKDLGDIVRFMKQEAGMAILLFTTGWFLEARMDEVLPNIDVMVVSVDSANPARHDEIRGLPGLFDRLVKGVRMARARYPELSIQLNCCVQRGVAEEVDALVELARELDVRISFDVITEYRNGDGGPLVQTDEGMPLEELQTLCAKLLEKKRAGAPIVNSELYFDYFVQGRKGYRCHLPKLVMFVDGRGRAEHCLDLTKPLGSIRDTPLAEIMDSPRFKQLRCDAEQCSSCNSPTMVDLSHVWENPQMVFERGGIALG